MNVKIILFLVTAVLLCAVLLVSPAFSAAASENGTSAGPASEAGAELEENPFGIVAAVIVVILLAVALFFFIRARYFR